MISIKKVANSIFGREEELLLNSFMEKIEKNIIPNHKRGKNLIKANTVLEITLEDYIHSRKNYSKDNVEKDNPVSEVLKNYLIFREYQKTILFMRNN